MILESLDHNPRVRQQRNLQPANAFGQRHTQVTTLSPMTEPEEPYHVKDKDIAGWELCAHVTDVKVTENDQTPA